MLHVDFLEATYQAAKPRHAGPLSRCSSLYWLSLCRGSSGWPKAFSPRERMIQTMTLVEHRDLTARNSTVGGHDEIGQVAAHLDTLLDQAQDRDCTEELNARVDKRTAELLALNPKLEDTFKQLMMIEKLASNGEITAGVAHKINNPVAVTQGNIDVISDPFPVGRKAEINAQWPPYWVSNSVSGCHLPPRVPAFRPRSRR